MKPWSFTKRAAQEMLLKQTLPLMNESLKLKSYSNSSRLSIVRCQFIHTVRTSFSKVNEHTYGILFVKKSFRNLESYFLGKEIKMESFAERNPKTANATGSALALLSSFLFTSINFMIKFFGPNPTDIQVPIHRGFIGCCHVPCLSEYS